jgi:hypothetical protein
MLSMEQLFPNVIIRSLADSETMWYSAVDIIAAAQVASNPRGYWSDLKRDHGHVYAFSVHVKSLPDASGMRSQQTDCLSLVNALYLVTILPLSPATLIAKRKIAEAASR